MVTAQEICDTVHTNIHALRMIGNYKPTQFEIKISYLISTMYENKCAECKAVLDSKRQTAENQIAGNVPMKNNSFMDKLLRGGK